MMAGFEKPISEQTTMNKDKIFVIIYGCKGSEKIKNALVLMNLHFK
jgi:hypothetical protein